MLVVVLALVVVLVVPEEFEELLVVVLLTVPTTEVVMLVNEDVTEDAPGPAAATAEDVNSEICEPAPLAIELASKPPAAAVAVTIPDTTEVMLLEFPGPDPGEPP